VLRVAVLDMAARLRTSHLDITDCCRAVVCRLARLFAHVFERYAGEALVAQDLADPPIAVELLDLARVRLQALLFEPDSETTSTLDSVMKRLFDPKERDLLTVSAFSSSL
jgi:hypothetical protein